MRPKVHPNICAAATRVRLKAKAISLALAREEFPLSPFAIM